MTLYITSNRGGFTPVEVSLNYADNGTYDVAPYTLGDVNNDGMWNTTDAMSVLRYAVGLEELTATQLLAANVNGDSYINSTDALFILQYGVGIRTSWT